jgi:hypothetical protein
MNQNIKNKIKWKYKDKEGTYDDTFGFLYKDEFGEINDYWWTEGNGACDCNRGSMFLGLELPCGDTIEILEIEPY